MYNSILEREARIRILSCEGKPQSRLERLQSMLPKGVRVDTYSPGDGVTRYKFYVAEEELSYFAVSSSKVLAVELGYANAERYASGVAAGYAISGNVPY